MRSCAIVLALACNACTLERVYHTPPGADGGPGVDGRTPDRDGANCVGCALDNADGACVDGACVISACHDGYADCDERDDTGCEVDTRVTAEHCGACGTGCDEGWVCSDGTCVDVPVAISAGWRHTCSVRASGVAVCWGRNTWGQLGLGSMSATPTLTPTAVGISVRSVAASLLEHSCAVDDTGAALCWGRNDAGQLGVGDASVHPSPTVLTYLDSGSASVSAGDYHSCAMLETGQVRCAGSDALGRPGTAESVTPVIVDRIADAVEIDSGKQFACARLFSGRIACWGRNSGGLGDGVTTTTDAPIYVQGIADAVALSVGGSHACAVTSDASLWCWGGNARGQLGDGTTADRAVAVQVGELPMVVDVAAGSDHTCVLDRTGQIWCWGSNDFGQLGDGSVMSRTVPGRVVGFP